MTFIEHNKRIFVEGKESLYRRLSVRECAFLGLEGVVVRVDLRLEW
jgi:hypothetical protein